MNPEPLTLTRYCVGKMKQLLVVTPVDPTCSPLVIQSSSVIQSSVFTLTNGPTQHFRATVHRAVDLQLKSHPKDVEEQEHGDGHFLSLTEAGFPAVV